jgi:hypothetical protein
VLGRRFRPEVEQDLIAKHSKNSEVRANIPIPITRIIITIESKRTCITTIISVTTHMQNVPEK